MKKVMYAAFFRSTGLVSAIKLSGQKTVTAKWNTEKCLPDMFSKIPENHDNASSHIANITLQFLDEKKIKVIERPPYVHT